MKGETITSCTIDSLQAKVNFDASGVLAEMGQMLTKGQLGEAYGMKNAGSKYEWNEQIALFCEYVTGKTVDQVLEMAVTEGTSDADIVASVSIYIGGYQALVRKAAQ